MCNIINRLFGRWSLVRRIGNGRFSYAGPYRGGFARYAYVETPAGRVYDGPFVYSGGESGGRHRAFLGIGGGSVVSLRGRYEHGRKVGRWRYERRGHGYWRRLTAVYAGGRLDGVATYEGRGNSYGIGNGSRMVKLSLTIRGDKPEGQLVGHFNGSPFRGQFDADGYPDGLWTYGSASHKCTLVDYERWEHGALRESYSFDVSTGHRRDRSERLLAMVRDIIDNECLPLVNSIKHNAAVWNGEIKVRKPGV